MLFTHFLRFIDFMGLRKSGDVKHTLFLLLISVFIAGFDLYTIYGFVCASVCVSKIFHLEENTTFMIVFHTFQ